MEWEMKFKARDDIKQKREELREKLLKNFKAMCEKKVCCIQIPDITTASK